MNVDNNVNFTNAMNFFKTKEKKPTLPTPAKVGSASSSSSAAAGPKQINFIDDYTPSTVAKVDNTGKLIKVEKQDAIIFLPPKLGFLDILKIPFTKYIPGSSLYNLKKLAVMELLEKDPKNTGVAIDYLFAEYLDDEDVMSVAIRQDAKLIEHASQRIQKLERPLLISRKFAEWALRFDPDNIAKKMFSQFRDDEELMLMVVQQDDTLLTYASPRLQDKESAVARAALESSSEDDL